MSEMKPKKRNIIRITAGKLYYTCIRYVYWYFSKTRFARNTDNNLQPCIVFEHKTPLLRKLKNVDMWLQHNKVKNLAIAIKALDRIIIRPGETFSFWRVVGKPTRFKGYVKGLVLFSGGFGTGIGGGLCQMTNLIYWMTLHTPLTVKERYRHSYDVFPDADRTQPFGSGATCVYNYRDLQICNNTEETYQLHIYLTEEHLCGEWRASNHSSFRYEVYEKEHHIDHEIWGGYTRHNTICRKVFDRDGTYLYEEYLTENHAIMMYPPFLNKGCNSD
ncbi:MAG: VanW family protein [Bacillota bacterium]